MKIQITITALVLITGFATGVNAQSAAPAGSAGSAPPNAAGRVPVQPPSAPVQNNGTMNPNGNANQQQQNQQQYQQGNQQQYQQGNQIVPSSPNDNNINQMTPDMTNYNGSAVYPNRPYGYGNGVNPNRDGYYPSNWNGNYPSNWNGNYQSNWNGSYPSNWNGNYSSNWNSGYDRTNRHHWWQR
jgi:hypothetical protein